MYQCHDEYPADGYVSTRPRQVSGAQCHDLFHGYEGDSGEVILANAVRDWTERVAPGDDATIRAAVETALCLFAEGASVSEACSEARSMVMCRLRHPSHLQAPRHLAAAS